MSTRDDILITARDLFARLGYEAVGVQEICTAAGITKPSLYYHYGNKESLLTRVAADAIAGLVDAMGAVSDESAPDKADALPYSGDLVGDIRRLFAAIIAFSRTDPSRFQLALQLLYPPAGSALRRAGAPAIERLRTVLTGFFVRAATHHGNLAGKEAFLAVGFLGQAVALAMYLDTSTPPPASDSPDVVQAAQTFLYGIF